MSMYVYINTENHLPYNIPFLQPTSAVLWPAALAGLWPAGPELTEIPWMLMDVVHQWFVIQKIECFKTDGQHL